MVHKNNHECALVCEPACIYGQVIYYKPLLPVHRLAEAGQRAGFSWEKILYMDGFGRGFVPRFLNHFLVV